MRSSYPLTIKRNLKRNPETRRSHKKLNEDQAEGGTNKLDTGQEQETTNDVTSSEQTVMRHCLRSWAHGFSKETMKHTTHSIVHAC